MPYPQQGPSLPFSAEVLLLLARGYKPYRRSIQMYSYDKDPTDAHKCEIVICILL
jgi:hypothetical protein